MILRSPALALGVYLWPEVLQISAVVAATNTFRLHNHGFRLFCWASFDVGCGFQFSIIALIYDCYFVLKLCANFV